MSFLAEAGMPLRAVRVADAGSQFRSRDVFPGAVADLVRGDTSLLGPEVTVAAPPPRSVVVVDCYGNLNTSWYDAPAAVGGRVRVDIGGRQVDAVVSDGVFEVPDGQMSFAPGSSGWPAADGRHRACYELFARGASAAELFGHPSAGTAVTILAK
jgi:hypothetical protein